MVTRLGEDGGQNRDLGGKVGGEDFEGNMRNRGLPHPKQMDIAVPANLKCGIREGAAPVEEPDWGPLTLTFAGIWEIDPNWVEEHLRELQIVDVREPDEFSGPLGRIPGAKLLPLG